MTNEGSDTCNEKEFKEKVTVVNPDIEVVGDYAGFNNRITVKCKKCDYTFDPLVRSLLHGHGCPRCSQAE